MVRESGPTCAVTTTATERSLRSSLLLLEPVLSQLSLSLKRSILRSAYSHSLTAPDPSRAAQAHWAPFRPGGWSFAVSCHIPCFGGSPPAPLVRTNTTTRLEPAPALEFTMPWPRNSPLATPRPLLWEIMQQDVAHSGPSQLKGQSVICPPHEISPDFTAPSTMWNRRMAFLYNCRGGRPASSPKDALAATSPWKTLLPSATTPHAKRIQPRGGTRHVQLPCPLMTEERTVPRFSTF